MSENKLVHTKDLTPEDVDGLAAFVEERLSAYQNREMPRLETDEGKILYGLRRAVEQTVISLNVNFRQFERLVTEDDRRGLIRYWYDVRDEWNRLVSMTYAWREEPGYNTDRWLHTPYLDADDQQRNQELNGQDRG
ncbi:hypothetical protein ACFWOJ_37330 [Streptomyces sp. NPDC058439]|uniref:hypothetical protein n=1 Tax=Streptomyces sp. NPDC058439 TaxID=3346500 RepID=UPI003654940C